MVNFFLHKNNTFIQVFSSTSTYEAFIFSLNTKQRYGAENDCYICCMNWS